MFCFYTWDDQHVNDMILKTVMHLPRQALGCESMSSAASTGTIFTLLLFVFELYRGRILGRANMQITRHVLMHFE